MTLADILSQIRHGARARRRAWLSGALFEPPLFRSGGRLVRPASKGEAMRAFVTGLMICAVSVGTAAARDRKPSKEERRVEQLRISLESKSPAAYCEAALTFRPNGFYPYCSPITYPQTQHSFTLNAGVQAQKSVLVEMRQEGDRSISAKATFVEKALIDESKATNGEGCLGQSPAACISYLAANLFMTTAADIPFYDWSSQASFDPEKTRRRNLTLQIVLPHTDSRSYVKDFGFRDTSPPLDVVGISASVVEDKVESISFSGRFPILSDNPADYQGSGFANFMATVLPSCRSADEGEFYRAFWVALVKPREFATNSGKWRFTDNGVSKSYSSSAYGNLCGLKVSSFSSTGRTITDTGQDLSGSSQEVTFRLPNKQ
ncbi:hypothetical protein [Sphingomonas aracearum]|uniref:hypothetical protein n=1 Tax=Sphingomonas aracearum TaxID=2283317 RepID=UPI0011C044C4|nr:hypothetical protein [Sphingomonas aracearum]